MAQYGSNRRFNRREQVLIQHLKRKIGNSASSTGLPTGGTNNQVLKKDSATDFDASWASISGGDGISASGIALAVDLSAAASMEFSTGALQLTNDNATPGNSYYYGTNGAGTKGWYAASTIGSTTWLGLTDTPGSFTANAMYAANAAGTALVLTPLYYIAATPEMYIGPGVDLFMEGGDFTIETGDAFLQDGSLYVNSGSVGIGNTWLMQNEVEDAVARLTLKAVGANAAAEFFLHPTGTATTSRLTITDAVSTANYEGIAVQATTTVNTVDSVSAGTGTAQPIAFAIDGAEAMRIDTAGNVGIGNTNPTLGSGTPKFVVGDGTSRAEITIYTGVTDYCALNFADGTGAAAYRGMVRYYHNDNSLQFFTQSAERFRVDSSGQLGIGTTAGSVAVSAPLHLNSGSPTIPVLNAGTMFLLSRSGASNITMIGGTTSDVGINFGDYGDTDPGWIRYRHNGDTLDIRVAAAEKMQISSTAITLNSGNADLDFVVKDDNGGEPFRINGDTTPGIAFFGNAEITQTANETSLTDSTGGTADTTVAAVSGSGDDATINNNFADLINKVNTIISFMNLIKGGA